VIDASALWAYTREAVMPALLTGTVTFLFTDVEVD
jgi:hypothetical protein